MKATQVLPRKSTIKGVVDQVRSIPDLVQKAPARQTPRNRVAPVGALLLLLVTIAFVVVNLPDIRRYMRIRNM